jgi:hypothetical protein
MKRILILLVILISFGTIRAQEQDSIIGPKEGTVMVSLILGNASTYANSGWLQLPASLQNSYSIISPFIINNPSSNSLVNLVGLEGKWFFSNTWAVSLNGAAVLSATPAYEGTPGVYSGIPIANIPSYSNVPARQNAEVIINLGVAKYFATKNKHLFWYLSPVGTFHYGRVSGYEVTQGTTDPGTTRYAEGYGIGLSGSAGAEYFTKNGIFFGFEIQGVSGTYTVNSILPLEGMAPLRSNNYNFSFLSQPIVKLGFRF